MKRISLLIMFLIAALNSGAQMYFHIQSGYSVSTQPYVHHNRVITDSIINQFRIKFSYGKGLDLGMGIGYSFRSGFFTEAYIATAFLTRSSSNNNWEYYFRREYLKLHLSGLNGNAVMKNASLQVSPLIGYAADLGKFRPYIKAGMNFLYVKSTYTNHYVYRYLNESHEWYLEFTDLKREYKGNMALGFRGSAGCLFRLTGKLWISAEFMAVNSSYHFNESHTLSFKVDGVEKAGELEENPEKLKGDDGRVDYSHIGIHVGIKYMPRGK